MKERLPEENGEN